MYQKHIKTYKKPRKRIKAWPDRAFGYNDKFQHLPFCFFPILNILNNRWQKKFITRHTNAIFLLVWKAWGWTNKFTAVQYKHLWNASCTKSNICFLLYYGIKAFWGSELYSLQLQILLKIPPTWFKREKKIPEDPKSKTRIVKIWNILWRN